jgi:plastocyanin
MKKFIGICIVLLVLSMSVTSCSKAGTPAQIDVTMTDFHYTPSEWTIPAGKEVTMNIRNDGAVGHEYVIMKFGKSAGDKFGPEDEENIFWEVEVDAHSSKNVKFTAPSDIGAYEILCGTAGHMEAGMKAALTVAAN